MGVPHYTGKQFQVYLDADKAWDVIEYKAMGYDRDIDELYPEHFITENNHEKYKLVLSKVLLPDEQYVLFDDLRDGYALTSFGRMINCKEGNVTTIYFTKTKLSVSIRNVKIDIAHEFMKMGWYYNIDNIKRIYNENKWNIKDKNIAPKK